MGTKRNIGLVQVLSWVLLFMAGFGSGLLVGGRQPQVMAPPPVAAQGKVAGVVPFEQPLQEKPEGAPASVVQPQVAERHALSRPRRHPAAIDNQQALFWQSVAQLRGMAGDLLYGSSDPEQIREVVQQFSDEELLDLITTYTQLAPHDIPQGVSIPDYASRLGEIYYTDLTERAENPSDDLHKAQDVLFDVRTDSKNQAPEPKALFEAGAPRIYAVFDTTDYKERTLMVKWSRVDSPEVLVYKKYAINPSMDHNYVWLEQPGGWQPGLYKAEAYRDDLTLLGIGSYEVR